MVQNEAEELLGLIINLQNLAVPRKVRQGVKMNNKFGLYVLLGLIVGALFGASFIPVVENDMLAIACGALAGVFIGWYIFAAMNIRKQDRK